VQGALPLQVPQGGTDTESTTARQKACTVNMQMDAHWNFIEHGKRVPTHATGKEFMNHI
jgi:hypothetical protein